MVENETLIKIGYTGLAAFAGAVSALAAMKWKEMWWTEILLTLFVGFSFAIFMAPWLAHMVFRATDPRTVAALTYLMACGSNILLPYLIRKLRDRIGGALDDVGPADTGVQP